MFCAPKYVIKWGEAGGYCLSLFHYIKKYYPRVIFTPIVYYGPHFREKGTQITWWQGHWTLLCLHNNPKEYRIRWKAFRIIAERVPMSVIIDAWWGKKQRRERHYTVGLYPIISATQGLYAWHISCVETRVGLDTLWWDCYIEQLCFELDRYISISLLCWHDTRGWRQRSGEVAQASKHIWAFNMPKVKLYDRDT